MLIRVFVADDFVNIFPQVNLEIKEGEEGPRVDLKLVRKKSSTSCNNMVFYRCIKNLKGKYHRR